MYLDFYIANIIVTNMIAQENMDRKWVFPSQLSKEYEDGVKEFRRFAVEHAKNPSRIICPCLKCCHSKVVNANELEAHLVCNGIDKSYSCWTKHGEKK